MRVISTKINASSVNLSDKKIKKSLNYLSKFNNFALIIINNKRKNIDEMGSNTLRYYGIGAQIIKDLKIRKMILVTRTRKKIIGLEGFGLKIKKQEIIK